MTVASNRKAKWSFWRRWTAAYVLALTAGLFVFINSWYVTSFIAAFVVGDKAALYVGSVFSGAAGGAAFGFTHWYIWHGRTAGAKQWTLLNAAAWAVGLPLFTFVANMIHAIPAGLVLGCAIGGIQWLLLRKQFDYAGVWVVMSMLVWMIGWEVAKVPYGMLLSIAIIGTISGLVMMWLLEHPKQQIVNG